MEKGGKKIEQEGLFEKLNNFTKSPIFTKGIILFLIVIMFIGAAYLTFFYTTECKNYECFKVNMEKCAKATFINEEPEASWLYAIEGRSGENCAVNVKLLQAKEGELKINLIVGEEMKCYYPAGTSAYVQKDLSKCHGRLKEELQKLIIEKLHSYVLENLGTITKALNETISAGV